MLDCLDVEDRTLLQPYCPVTALTNCPVSVYFTYLFIYCGVAFPCRSVFYIVVCYSLSRFYCLEYSHFYF